MTIEEASQVLKRGRLEPVYVLAGPNRFWRSQWLSQARRTFLTDDADNTGLVRLEAPSDFGQVRIELAASGLFSSKKMVVVDGPRWTKKEDTVRDYLQAPVSDSLLVLLEDTMSASWETAVGRHRLVELTQLSSAAFRRFVRDEANKRHIRWDRDGFDVFCRLVGGNEYQVVEELEKARLWSPDVVTANDVREMVHPIAVEQKPWDVTDALIRRDGSDVLRRVWEHLSRGMSPLFLFIILARQVIQIDRARRAARMGRTMAEFQRDEGVKDFVAQKVWRAQRTWDDATLARLLAWAPKIDVAMKTGYGEPEVWLVFWVGLMLEQKIPPGRQRGGRAVRI